MGRFFLVSYHPLAKNAVGRVASQRHDLPPFIDGSIRREPDLQHPRPAITCLCRTDKFAPRLRPDDHVVYVTIKRPYCKGQATQQRLTSVVRVEQLIESHECAAAWYTREGLVLPSNIMVEGNPPRHLTLSHRDSEFKKLSDVRCLKAWDRFYSNRATKFPRVAQCVRVFTDLSWAAPSLDDEQLIAVFGKVPGTQNPAPHDIKLLGHLLRLLGIDALPSAP